MYVCVFLWYCLRSSAPLEYDVNFKKTFLSSPLGCCFGNRFLSSFFQALSRAHIFCVNYASRRSFGPRTFSVFYIKQPDHQETEEFSLNLSLQPGKTCFAGRDSAAEVRDVYKNCKYLGA